MTAVEQPADAGTPVEVSTSKATADDDITWTVVCPEHRVRPDRGVAVMFGDEPVALFRLSAFDGGAEEWRAVSHIDPLSGAAVMARGLVGTVGEPPLVVPTVASPLHKERYNLRSGHCLDDASAVLTTYPVRVRDGHVELGAPVTST